MQPLPHRDMASRLDDETRFIRPIDDDIMTIDRVQQLFDFQYFSGKPIYGSTKDALRLQSWRLFVPEDRPSGGRGGGGDSEHGKFNSFL